MPRALSLPRSVIPSEAEARAFGVVEKTLCLDHGRKGSPSGMPCAQSKGAETPVGGVKA